MEKNSYELRAYESVDDGSPFYAKEYVAHSKNISNITSSFPVPNKRVRYFILSIYPNNSRDVYLYIFGCPVTWDR